MWSVLSMSDLVENKTFVLLWAETKQGQETHTQQTVLRDRNLAFHTKTTSPERLRNNVNGIY